ncbi:MAG: hypothetical protein U5S82_18575 [Gammaproteobacteria bacterium]|nr:hypothetical protein [Gammaproteobacteria bacterium]
MKNPNEVEQLLCALMFMLTRQANNPGMSLATPIRDHLQWLAEHPETARQPMLRKTCRRLMLQWQGYDEGVGESRAAAATAAQTNLH